MATAIEASKIRECCLDIVKAEVSRDYDKALKASNKLIRDHKKEHYAFKSKAVALIQLNELDAALELINKTSFGEMGNVSFEKAYILYRKNDNDAAEAELKKADQSDPGVLELRAQLAYRQERFQEAYDLLVELLRTHNDDYDESRRANLIAVEAQLEAMGVSKTPQQDAESFEQLLNVGCHHVARGEYQAAVKVLDKAADVCRKTLVEDGAAEDEIDEELAVILVQKGFALQKLGRNDEALSIYSAVYEKQLSDQNARATLLNNLPTTRSEVNVGDVRKKLKAAGQVDKSKLTKRQQRTLLFNQALVHLLSNQREPCRRVLEDLRARFGVFNDAVLLETALFVRQKDVQAALATLQNAEQNTEAQLLKAQILINFGQGKEALEILGALPPAVRHLPALVALVVNLNLVAGNQEAAKKALQTAIEAAAKSGDVERHRLLLNKAAQVFTSIKDNEGAVKSLETLRSLEPDNNAVLCRLIKAYNAVGSPKAETLIAELEDASTSTADGAVNVDDLESQDWVLYGQKYRKKEGIKKDEVADTQIVTGKLKKKNRKRKIILPKNYDPNVPPDPERWLPKQERSTFKKKLPKRLKDRDIGRGTQGAASGAVSEAMDYSKHTATATAQQTPPQPSPSSGPRQKGPAGQQAKKKKPNKKKF